MIEGSGGCGSILLECGDWEKGNSYFKFENWWLKEEVFIDKLKERWSSSNATGRPDSQLASKLCRLKVKLKEWSKANKNNWKERKDLIHHKWEIWNPFQDLRLLTDDEQLQ